jgi:mannose-6-phosphate isomerase
MYQLIGKVQHYAWGGKEFIPSLLGISNTEGQPFAEYWMGVHTLAPSVVRITDNAFTGLHDLIRSEPRRYLGEKVAAHFRDLPFLLKILDVKEMLSIQVHPSREEAQKGFDIENAAGVPADAPHRNYRDNNHKPEMMLALGDFWLLHGFRKEEDLLIMLERVGELSALIPLFEDKGYKGLYQYVMELPQEGVNKLLQPLAARILPLYSAGEFSRNDPDFWAARAMITYPDNFDCGIFSIYFFNLVHLKAGEAIFQGAGLPHAYLEGQNVELMSNSDNVLRGGLTPKHVDVPELMKHTSFKAVIPEILVPGKDSGEHRLEFPVRDFGLTIATVNSESQYRFRSEGPEILLVLEGSGSIGEKKAVKGSSFFITPGEDVACEGDFKLVRAWVP